MILPLTNFIGNSTGEEFIWQKFNEFLPSSFISFHNYYLGLKQVDIIMLVPNRGILIIEVKGYYAKNIIDVPDRQMVRTKNKPPEFSAFEQAIKYRNLFLEDFLKPNHISSVYIPCAVCYPYIKKEEYKEKGLDKISHERVTITADDLESSTLFLEKIEDIFNLVYNSVAVPGLIQYSFDSQLMERVGNIISPNFKNGVVDADIEEVEHVQILKREAYSRLIYVKKTSEYKQTQIDELIKQWISGTKIFLYAAEQSFIDMILKRIKDEIKTRELLDRDAFAITEGGTFLFNSGVAINIENDFEIINGEGFQNYTTELDFLHEESGFNKGQFEIEHAPLEDLIVKAGAGTGKTFSLVSRINYLIWKKEYEPIDLNRAIAMITFTNESANSMKEKLSNNFLSYYLLTKDIRFLEFIECVEDMNISTIHSMARRILKKYSSNIGLGKDFTIISGDYKRGQILHQKLNKHIELHPEFSNKIDISIFHLEKRLLSFLEKMDNKNIDIVEDKKYICFGKANNIVFEDLLDVIFETQMEMNSYCNSQNSISLGDLIKKLKTLVKMLNFDKLTANDKVDFLFVDEFQDTDDVQIELIKAFKNIFSFKLFVVGDIKQCIYRFRGAEVKAFDTLKKGINDIPTISLNKNYRTDTMLLNKMNNIFSIWDKKNDIDYSGKDVLKGTKKYCEQAELYGISFDSDNTFEKKLIESIYKSKEELCNNDKIAILVRNNREIAQIREVCEKNKISIETENGGELFRIDPTIDLYKLILALKFNLSPKHLYNLYTTSYVKDRMPKIEIWSLNEESIVKYFYENLPKEILKWNVYIERLRVEPVLKVLRDIVDDIKPWEIFSEKMEAAGENIKRLESYYIRNLDQLFEKLIIASNTDYLTINKLSDYLEIMILTRREEMARASYDLEESKSQIICTTVHKSKGLEFNTVILPYCSFDISSKKAKGDVDLIYSDNEVAYRIIDTNFKPIFENNLYRDFQENEVLDRKREETRILYVAMTRAIKRIIYFTNNTTKLPKNQVSWQTMIKEGSNENIYIS